MSDEDKQSNRQWQRPGIIPTITLFGGYIATFFAMDSVDKHAPKFFGENVTAYLPQKGAGFWANGKKGLARLGDLKCWKSNAALFATLFVGTAASNFIASEMVARERAQKSDNPFEMDPSHDNTLATASTTVSEMQHQGITDSTIRERAAATSRHPS